MIAIKKSRQGQLWYKEIKKILLSRNIILHGEVSLYIFKKIIIIVIFFLYKSQEGVSCSIYFEYNFFIF